MIHYTIKPYATLFTITLRQRRSIHIFLNLMHMLLELSGGLETAN